MRKKLLSALMAAAMILTALPQQLAFAAENAQQYPLMKFGLSAGDVVSFGSKDSVNSSNTTVYYTAPQKFLVLDADASSTGDTDGAFFITKDVTERTVNRGSTGSTVSTEYRQFLGIFTDDEQNMLADTVKDSQPVTINEVSGMEEAITTAQKIFLLSADEVTKYADLLTLNPGKSWALRSEKTGYSITGGQYAYVGYVNASNQLSVDYLSNYRSRPYSFRPGMNLSKTAVAVGTPFGEKILLLPFAASETGSFRSAYADTKQDYILPVRDSGIGAIKAETLSIDGQSYTVRVTAERTDGNVADDEYITFIITDSDSDNILHFGRFKKTGGTSDISLTLPDSVSAESCKMYVFSEVYNQGKVSKISDLASVCMQHDYSRTENDDGTHTATCQNCGHTENHSYVITSNDDDTHTISCAACQYAEIQAHDKKYVHADAYLHTITCAKCDYNGAGDHRISYTKTDSAKHEKYCQDGCGYTELEVHGDFQYTITSNGHLQTCGHCGYSESWSHGIEFIDNGAEEHILRCQACGYETKEKHSYGKWTDKGETHERVCSGCERVQTAAHSFTSGAASIDANQHTIYCADCNATRNTAHNFVYTSLKNGTHTKVCKDCQYQTNERHTFAYADGADGSARDLICSVCQTDLGIQVTASSVTDGVSKRLGAVDLTKTSCSRGNVSGASLVSNLFEENENDLVGSALLNSDKTYTLAIDFAMTHPIALEGFILSFGESVKVYGNNMPKYVIVSGKNEGDSDYTAIETIGTVDFILDTSDNAYTYRFADRAKAYQYYRIELINYQDYIQLNSFIPLSAEGTEPMFNLSGVVIKARHDLIVPGEDYECTLVTKQGHPSAVSVTCNAERFTDYTYSEESGILHINGDKIQSGAYTISVTAENEPALVKKDFYRLQFSGADTARFTENYIGYFLDYNGKKTYLPQRSDITVTIGGTEFENFIYNSKTGRFTIPGQYITGDIVIKAAEWRSVKQDDSAAAVTVGDDVPRYYSQISDIVSLLSGKTNANITFFGNLEGKWDLENTNAVFNLGGFAAACGDSDSYLLNTDLSDVKIENGSLTAEGAAKDGAYVLNGSLTLGNRISLTAGRTGVRLDDAATLVVDGASIVGGASAVEMAGKNSSLVVKNGTLKGAVLVNGKNCKLELSGGTFDSISGSGLDFFSFLAGGYAYRMNAPQNGTIAEVFGGDALASFSVEQSPFAYAAERKQVDFGYRGAIRLESDVNAAAYQWYRNGEAIEGATESTYTVETGLASGQYEYVCIASGEACYAPVERVSLTVYCAHTSFDENGKCASCGHIFEACVTNEKGETVFYESIYEAVDAAEEGSVIKLLTDVKLPEGENTDSGENIGVAIKTDRVVLDLNNKSMSFKNEERVDVGLWIYSAATVRNGSLHFIVYICEEAGQAVLENLTVTKETYIDSDLVKLVSGNYHGLYSEWYSLSHYLEEGKTLMSNDGWVDADDNRSYESEVRIVSAPFIMTKQPQSVHLKNADYTEGGTLSAEVQQLAGYENETVTYQWYVDSKAEGAALMEGETSSTLNIPTGLADGSARYYFCEVTCAGYVKRSDRAAVAVGDVKPKLSISPEKTDCSVRVEGHGLTGQIVIAGYDEDGRMTDVAQAELTTKGSNQYDTRIFEKLGFGSRCETIKVFLLDADHHMLPLCPSQEASISYLNQ